MSYVEESRELLIEDFDLLRLYQMEARERETISDLRAKKLLGSLKTTKSNKTREEIKTTLIEGSLGWVFGVAWWFRACGMERADLVGNGNLGLVGAVDRWTGKDRISWYHHACQHIRWAIIEGLEENGLLHIPKRQDKALLNKLRKLKKDKESHGEQAHPRDLIKEILPGKEETSAQWRRARALLDCDLPVVSLDTLDLEILQVVSEREKGASFEKVEEWLETARLTEGPKGERMAMSLLFGSNGDGCNYTYEDVGDKIGVHRSRVGILFKKSEHKMRTCLPQWAGSCLREPE